jgi:hypothetical protein
VTEPADFKRPVECDAAAALFCRVCFAHGYITSLLLRQLSPVNNRARLSQEANELNADTAGRRVLRECSEILLVSASGYF